jgi:hypothetical protein
MSTLRTLSLILSIISAASIGWSSHAGLPRSAAADPPSADGRLGGTRASFDRAYADEQPEVTGSGTLFSFDDLGLFLINFQSRTVAVQPTDVAAVIIVSSPRDPATAASDPDDHDWTMDEATATALRFLPTDARISVDGTPTASQASQPTCRSDLLARTDFGAGAGKSGCQVAFIQPTPHTVSFMTLSLTDPDTPFVRQDPCREMSDWARQTGANMADAETLIASIQRLDLTADDASERLGTIADGLMGLADSQRLLVAPPPAARAQLALTTALDAYVTALNLAAGAIDAADDDLLNQAVALVTTARDDYATADDRVLLALRVCSLAEVAT